MMEARDYLTWSIRVFGIQVHLQLNFFPVAFECSMPRLALGSGTSPSFPAMLRQIPGAAANPTNGIQTGPVNVELNGHSNGRINL